MKNTKFLIILSGIIIFSACRKNEDPQIAKMQNRFIKEAVTYLHNTLDEEDFQKLDFSNFQKTSANEQISVMTIPQKDKSSTEHIIVGEVDGKYYGNWVNASNFIINENGQQGIVNTRSFDNSLKNEVTFLNNKAVKISETKNGKAKIKLIKYNSDGEIIRTDNIGKGVSLREIDEDGYTWISPVVITGYVSNSAQIFYSLYWAFNQNPAYLYSYSTVPVTSGGGSNGGGSSGQAVQIPPYEIPSGAAINLNKYIKCFDNLPNNGAVYSITIYADIPVNSNSNVAALGGTPGHAFITLTKTNGSSSVTQTFGFYPQSGIKSILDVPTTSKMNDNSGHEYNASLTMNNVSEANFNAAKSTALSKSTNQYDLNDYNCTDYALDVFNAGRTNNKITLSDWLINSPAGTPPYYYPPTTLNYGTIPMHYIFI